MDSARGIKIKSAPRRRVTERCEMAWARLTAQDWREVARGYEDEMRAALDRGDLLGAVMWRDCADVAWRAAEEV
jgi:hypothetical protein